MKKKQKGKHKVLSVIGEGLLWALALFCVSFSLVNVIDAHTGYSCSFFGFRTSVILTESMAYSNPENTYLDESMSRINKHDVITAREVGYDEIKVYDVVLHVEEGTLICHRVVDKYTYENVNYLVTRGDSNNLDDAPFAYSLCKGKVINVIPKVGEAVLFFQSGYFLLALCTSVFLVSGTLFTISVISSKKEKKKALEGKSAEESSPKGEDSHEGTSDEASSSQSVSKDGASSQESTSNEETALKEKEARTEDEPERKEQA